MIMMVRRVGAAVLAVAAIVVWFTMGPDNSSAVDRSDQINQALAEYELNESRTSGAPQQTVVNGWVAKDLLTVIAKAQTEEVAQRDERVPALVALLVLGLALAVATSARPTPLAAADAPDLSVTSAQPGPDNAQQPGLHNTLQ